MKLLLGLAAFLLVISTSWVYFSSPPSRASTGTNIYVPLVIQGWMEKVAIVQQDGHQAVYWPSPLPPGPYYYYPTPTPVAGIPIYLEVQNYTSSNMTGVTVEFQAFDSTGALITQTVTQTATLIDVLRPGQRSPVVFNIPFPGGYPAFQAATKGFTVLPNWSFTDRDPQSGLEVRWSPPWGPSPPPPPYAPTPTPTPSLLPNVYGWVKNTGTNQVSGVSVVVTVRGNEQASGLVLEATRVSIPYPIYPGSTATFNAYFGRNYGSLVGRVEAVAQRRLDIPGILEASSW